MPEGDEGNEPPAGGADQKPVEAPATGANEAKPEELGEGGLKALQAERARTKELEARLKDLEPLAAKAREAEEANKSELQKASEQIGTLEGRAVTAETKLLRHEIADAKGLPAEAKSLLSGTTKEEIEASADALLALLGDKGKGDRRPDPTLGKGGDPAKTADAWLREQASR